MVSTVGGSLQNTFEQFLLTRNCFITIRFESFEVKNNVFCSHCGSSDMEGKRLQFGLKFTVYESMVVPKSCVFFHVLLL